MYGALPTRPRLGLAMLPNCPISTLDDGLLVYIFSFLKPNHLRFTGQTLRGDGEEGGTGSTGYRCSIDNKMRMGELVSYVSIVELIQCSMVCRQWRRCAQLRSLWEEVDLSRFRKQVTDDLVLRIALRAGRRLRSLCLNHCKLITDVSMYHLSTHCPLIQELHFQGCTLISSSAVLALIRTLAYRNCLLRKPAVLTLEMAKCPFLTPTVLEDIEKCMYAATLEATAITIRRRREHDKEIEISRSTLVRAGAPACSRLIKNGQTVSNADEAWRNTFELDVGLCNLCNAVVDVSDVGRCSICANVVCEHCSDTPSTCELCCESFCNECRLVASCVSCMKDYCDDCQEILMCGECDAVLCPECNAEHECTAEPPAQHETKLTLLIPAPSKAAPPPDQAAADARAPATVSTVAAATAVAAGGEMADAQSPTCACMLPQKHAVFKRLPVKCGGAMDGGCAGAGNSEAALLSGRSS